jgi:hypothetical protein
MLHELIMALLGCSGGVIIENEDGTFQVDPTHTFLSQAEVELINRVVSLGAFYKQIKAFVKRNGGISTQLAINLAYNDPSKRLDEQDG